MTIHLINWLHILNDQLSINAGLINVPADVHHGQAAHGTGAGLQAGACLGLSIHSIYSSFVVAILFRCKPKIKTSIQGNLIIML